MSGWFSATCDQEELQLQPAPCSRFTLSAHPGGAKSQTITAGWLHWESHNFNSMPICSCANTAKQTAGGPCEHISCLCWPRVTGHPSEVTPALVHKVNLPLKTWYLLTRLIEIDGCMTFIEFFYEQVLVVTPFIRASVRLGCYSSWTPALAAVACLMRAHKEKKETGREWETQMTRAALSYSLKLLDWH